MHPTHSGHQQSAHSLWKLPAGSGEHKRSCLQSRCLYPESPLSDPLGMEIEILLQQVRFKSLISYFWAVWLGEFVEPFLNFLISEMGVAITLTSGGLEVMMYIKPVAQSLIPEYRCNNQHFSDKEQSPVRPSPAQSGPVRPGGGPCPGGVSLL